MSRFSDFWRSPFVRLAGYYVIFGGAVYGVARLIPAVLDAFTGERLGELARRGLPNQSGHYRVLLQAFHGDDNCALRWPEKHHHVPNRQAKLPLYVLANDFPL